MARTYIGSLQTCALVRKRATHAFVLASYTDLKREDIRCKIKRKMKKTRERLSLTQIIKQTLHLPLFAHAFN